MIRPYVILRHSSYGRIAANEFAGMIRPYVILRHSSYGRIAANEFAGMIRPYFTLPPSRFLLHYGILTLILCGDDLTLGTAISVHHRW